MGPDLFRKTVLFADGARLLARECGHQPLTCLVASVPPSASAFGHEKTAAGP